MPAHAAQAGLLAFCGGLLQTGLSLALWRLRPYNAERRALADLYVELSKMAHAVHIDAAESPPASAPFTHAQQTLASLDRDRSVDGERYRMLLSEAERIRLSMLALRRVRARIRREAADSEAAGVLGSYFETLSAALEQIGRGLAAPAAGVSAPVELARFEPLSRRLREACASADANTAAMIGDARSQMDAIAGQLRAAVDLAAHADPAGQAAYARREHGKPWGLRLAGTLATLRANLHLQSAAFRHAVRLAGCVAIGDAVGTTVEFLPRGAFEPLVDLTGGGPFALQAGQWTDDTSMALCLATSLVERGCFDARDQMDRYCRWAETEPDRFDIRAFG